MSAPAAPLAAAQAQPEFTAQPNAKSQPDLAALFRAARNVSTPIIAVNTPDPAATVRQLAGRQNGDPLLVWDCVQGLTGINPAGKEAKLRLKQATGSLEFETSPVEMLVVAQSLPTHSVLFLHNAGRFFEQTHFVQALANLRDPFKESHRTVVLLGPARHLPPELAGDVIALDEPLPDPPQLAAIVQAVFEAAEIEPDAGALERAVEAVQGLAAFAAEQVTAMSMTRSGLDLDALWRQKRQAIEQTPGLKVYAGSGRFADIGGVPIVKEFLAKIIHGKARPNAVVFVDEIEKSLAGSGSDTSGVAQDQLGVLLAHMQDVGAAGLILVGPPGTSKSQLAKATGNEAGIPTIQLDLGATKGSLVGSSEERIRAALKVISAVSNVRELWIATCNNLTTLPPELRRRFTLGIYMLDLPDAAERAAIWNIWRAKYALSEQALPADAGWTGSEIKQCCDLAWRLDCPLVEAGRYVVPVSQSAAEQLQRLRELADGRFLSASQPGVYRQERPEAEADSRPKRGSRRMVVARD